MLSNCGAREDSWESLGLQQSNQSVLKEINLKYSLEGLGLRLKLQYFGSLMQRTNSLEKTLRLGKTEDKEEKGATEDEMVGWHHRFNGHEFGQTLETVKGREAWCAAVHGVTKSWTRLSNWTKKAATPDPVSQNLHVKRPPPRWCACPSLPSTGEEHPPYPGGVICSLGETVKTGCRFLPLLLACPYAPHQETESFSLPLWIWVLCILL